MRTVSLSILALAAAAMLVMPSWRPVIAQEGGEDAPADIGERPAQPSPQEDQPKGSEGEQADEKKDGDKPPGKTPDKRPGSQMWILILMVGGFVFLYFIMGRGRRKEQKRRREMLAALKKGDKITTIGGIMGSVVEVREKEVVVKVDESANVRMKFARSAISRLGEELAADEERPGTRGQQ